ncbi:unnamed protein product [Lecanosticta acicola]|uniref:Unnamed protein product n=1 Tax=Lecanosticta acicola TaxID=111012 RepID=A0AAI8Z6B4_9PEZI|nr:unnamed protein product [Lecanosticta acicola]
MNYANMIEEKNLKKGFIIATLLSTVIGTFTASMTLQDKISEKRAKKKQAKTDRSQDNQLKEMQEKSPSRSSRSRSSSRRRPPRNLDDDAYLAANGARSKDMIERTYQDHLARLGPKYARGDLMTENKLQAQVIQLQQTVIGVLQDALYNGRNLSEEDLRRLIAAQNSARDGSIEALQGQYERMLALEKKSNGSGSDQGSAPRALPEPQARETLADYGVPPQRRPSSFQEVPRRDRDRDREKDFVPEAAMAAGVFGTTGLGIAARAASRHESPQPRSTRTEVPPQSRKDSGLVGADSPRDQDGPRAPKTETNGGVKSTKAEVGGAAGKGGAEERPKSTMGDRGNGGDASKSVKGEGQKSTKAESNGPSKAAAPQGDKDNAKATKGDTAPKSTKTEAPKSTKTEAPKSTKTEAPKSTKTEAPKSRNGAPPPGKDAQADGAPAKEWYPPRKPRSQEAGPPSLPRAAPPKARSASPKRRAVSRPPPTRPKALPEAPAGDLFCRYSIDLQEGKLPLHPTFSGMGNHRCPACKILVPVDVRDVWVISTSTTNNSASSKQASSKPHADYRMDARFIVKCHTAANQRAEGGFACVLCDRYRDLDCICKSVDALVKHVGSAHGPEEYERDGDLHRMKKGGNVEVNGREFVLA